MTKKSTSQILNVRDTSGDLHAAAARISKALTGTIDYSAGVVHALSFTDTYYRRISKPIDYATTPIDVLRDYAVHGYDFTIRAPALAEIERRYQTGEVTQ